MSSENNPKSIYPMDLVFLEEPKLRMLAIEMAKDIADPLEILRALNISHVDYELIKESRAFKTMYNAALAEWTSAGNTQKRVKFKAAAAVEEVLAQFHDDMKNKEQPLSARVELLKTMARFGAIGNQEPLSTNSGQFFKLEIHLDGKKEPIVVNGGRTIDSSAERESQLVTAEDNDEF
jgi:hypothetical protein